MPAFANSTATRRSISLKTVSSPGSPDSSVSPSAALRRASVGPSTLPSSSPSLSLSSTSSALRALGDRALLALGRVLTPCRGIEARDRSQGAGGARIARRLLRADREGPVGSAARGCRRVRERGSVRPVDAHGEEPPTECVSVPEYREPEPLWLIPGKDTGKNCRLVRFVPARRRPACATPIQKPQTVAILMPLKLSIYINIL